MSVLSGEIAIFKFDNKTTHFSPVFFLKKPIVGILQGKSILVPSTSSKILRRRAHINSCLKPKFDIILKQSSYKETLQLHMFPHKSPNIHIVFWEIGPHSSHTCFTKKSSRSVTSWQGLIEHVCQIAKSVSKHQNRRGHRTLRSKFGVICSNPPAYQNWRCQDANPCIPR